MGILRLFRSKKPRDHFAERRAHLMAHGRICDGRIIDTETNGRGDEIVFYLYTLNGVDFESSELLDEEQRRDPLRYAPGAKVGVRYDPKNQGNSMLV
ncbi:MAG: hypothetical protein ABI646_07375 [Acidobacteriota bacterium]